MMDNAEDDCSIFCATLSMAKRGNGNDRQDRSPPAE